MNFDSHEQLKLPAGGERQTMAVSVVASGGYSITKFVCSSNDANKRYWFYNIKKPDYCTCSASIDSTAFVTSNIKT